MTRREFLAVVAVAWPIPQRSGAQRRVSPPPPAAPDRVFRFKPVRGVPPDIVGVFRDPLAFEQARSGQYFVFDRLGHTVYGIDEAMTGSWPVVRIGRETGRILEPTAFALAPNGTFAVADRPGASERVQLFGPGGSLIGGFTLPGRAGETLVLGSLVLNGIASLQYDGRTLFMSQPETGALVAEYAPTGAPIRTFGALRPTGHEGDRDLHLALNAGLPVVNPRGGHYFVFQAGAPLFRKYGPNGALLFERHVEGPELDPILSTLPTTWPTRRAGTRELPLVAPVVRAARADAAGRLWISFATIPFTYVYDSSGEKVRVVQFAGAGLVTPSSLFFSHTGRLLVAPGCFEYDPAAVASR